SSLAIRQRSQGVHWVRNANTGLADQLTALEQQVYGNSYASDGIMRRVRRLESQLFPNILISESEDLKSRVGRIGDRVEDLADAHALPVSRMREETAYGGQQLTNQSVIPNYYDFGGASKLPAGNTRSDLDGLDRQIRQRIHQLANSGYGSPYSSNYGSGYANQMAANNYNTSYSQKRSRSHGFKRAVLGVLKNIAVGVTYPYMYY
ncbi:MAG TPA: hypothetical protein V6C72_08715, partial [Chroococcales cyanobacterium]